MNKTHHRAPYVLTLVDGTERTFNLTDKEWNDLQPDLQASIELNRPSINTDKV